MISKLENKIAIRYLKTRKRDGFLNVVSIFSFIGISLGVAVLIIVMSVMNGFRAELINKIVGFNSHVVIDSYGKISGLKFNREFDKLVHAYIETNYGEAVLINENFTKGLSIRGYKAKEIRKLPIFKNDKNIDNKLLGKTIVIGKELPNIKNFFLIQNFEQMHQLKRLIVQTNLENFLSLQIQIYLLGGLTLL